MWLSGISSVKELLPWEESRDCPQGFIVGTFIWNLVMYEVLGELISVGKCADDRPIPTERNS